MSIHEKENASERLLLLSRPTRVSTEGINGYLLRLAEANGLAGISRLWTGRKRSTEILEQRLGAQRWPQNIAAMHEVLPQLTCTPGTRPVWNQKNSRYCPRCLSDNPLWRWEWELTLFTCCPKHVIHLIEECWACGSKLNWSRQNLMYCDCGVSLAEAIAVPATRMDSELAEIFTSKLYRSGCNHEHLSILSLEQLHRVTYMLGAYAINEGRKFSQKISNVQDLMVSNPIVSAAAEILIDWPKNFHALLSSLRKSGEINVRDQRLTKRFGFFYQYVYQDLKDPEYAFLLQAFEAYISRTWRGPLAERNTRLSPAVRQRHTWVPISVMAKELKTTKRKLQLLIDQGRIESHVTKTQLGRTLTCVSRREIVEMRSALENVIDFKETAKQLGLTKGRTTQLIKGKTIEAAFQPRTSGTARWGIPQENVMALLSFGWDLPTVNPDDRPDLLSLAHALRHLLREAHLFPTLIVDVLKGEMRPCAAATGVEGLPSWLFDRSSLLEWIRTQRRIAMPGFISIPEAATRLGVRQQAVYFFVHSSQLICTRDLERKQLVILETDLERFSTRFILCHEIKTQFKLLPGYFIPRLGKLGVIPVSGPGIDSGCNFLFKREPALFSAMTSIVGACRRRSTNIEHPTG